MLLPVQHLLGRWLAVMLVSIVMASLWIAVILLPIHDLLGGVTCCDVASHTTSISLGGWLVVVLLSIQHLFGEWLNGCDVTSHTASL